MQPNAGGHLVPVKVNGNRLHHLLLQVPRSLAWVVIPPKASGDWLRRRASPCRLRAAPGKRSVPFLTSAALLPSSFSPPQASDRDRTPRRSARPAPACAASANRRRGWHSRRDPHNATRATVPARTATRPYCAALPAPRPDPLRPGRPPQPASALPRETDRAAPAV